MATNSAAPIDASAAPSDASAAPRDPFTELKSVIRAVLISNPAKCTLQNLCKEYREMEGSPIPFRRLGFSSVEELLYSMPDTVKVFGSGIYAEVAVVQSAKSTHISYMISKQKNSGKSARRPRQRYIPPQRREPPPPPQQRRPPAPRPLMGMTVPRPLMGTNQQPNRPPSNLNFEPERVQNNEYREPQPSTSAEVRVMPGGLESDEEAEEDDYITPLPSADSPSSEYRSKVPVDVQNRLRKLIQEHPSGIFCSKLPTRYMEKYGQPLRYDRYGYRSMIAMCSDLPDIFHYTQPSSDDFLIFDKNVPLPVYEKNDTKTDEMPNGQREITGSILSDLNLNWNLGSILIPSDVLHLTETVRRVFPKTYETGDVINVCMGELYDPSKFWVYLDNGVLTNLMDELNEFFNAQSNKYAVPEVLLEEGFYCVTLYCGEFHRAVIINTLPRFPDQMKVLFIDYGTVGWVQSSQVYYLPRKFAKTPSQAIRARLANIVPPIEGTPWSTEAMTYFRDQVNNSDLMAEITHIDYDDRVLEIYLADITNREDIFYVNDELVEQGLAVFADQPRTKLPVDDPNCKCLVKNFHLCPSFEEIEGGFAPMLSEINQIIDLKIGVNHALPQYFNTKYRDDINYHECRFERISTNSVIPQPPNEFPSKDFDYSVFPEDLVSEIHTLVKGNDTTETIEKIEKVPPMENSFSGRTNRKRVADLLRTYSDTPTESSSCTSSLSDQKDDSISSTPSPLLELRPNSTNPFLNGSQWMKTTNPFFSEFSPTLSTVELPKPSEATILKPSEATIPKPPEAPQRWMKGFAPEKMNPFLKSWSHNCGKSEKAVQVELQDISASVQSALPVIPRKIRTPPGFERKPDMAPPMFVPGHMQQFNNYQMPQPQFYQQRFPCQQFTNYSPPFQTPYRMPMQQGPPIGYHPQSPYHPQAAYHPQANHFGNYMSSTLHSQIRPQFFKPSMPPHGFTRLSK